MIGIQPQNLEFDGQPTDVALRAADLVADRLIKAVHDMEKNGA